MSAAAQIAAIVVAAANAGAGLWGGWLWWRVAQSRAAWVAIRAAQGLTVAFALFAGGLYLGGLRPSGLFWLYLLLPIAVGFVGEQLRILSAETVLEARGIPDAKSVGALPAAQQRSVVTAIVRRELGVVALACLVSAFLALRAYGTV